jgi:hypothetical protein
MEAILVCKQLCDVALGVTTHPTGGQNAIHAWDQKNQEAYAKLQLAMEPDQLVHIIAQPYRRSCRLSNPPCCVGLE